MSTDDADLPVSSLEPRIRAILTAPGVDFQTISAKRVRRQLAEDDTLPAGYVRARKEALDELITRVFAQISEENGLGGSDQEPDDQEQDQDQEPADEEGEEEVDAGEKQQPRPAKRKRSADEAKARPAKKKAGRELSDAELARKIDSELNGRQRRSRASAAGTGKANGARKRKAKSAETVDSDGDGDGEAKPKRKGGFSKEYLLSEPLAAMLQAERMSRPQVVKGLWDHIKGNSLQNPENKREIMCDGALRAIFKTDKIGMFQMNKVLGQHLSEPES
ncbi:SWIB-domain-containing protein [Dentipellis sp. KUC8613]|nr:SWIB-domain-containing protein [Dentipellis sp. KUC8613]